MRWKKWVAFSIAGSVLLSGAVAVQAAGTKDSTTNSASKKASLQQHKVHSTANHADTLKKLQEQAKKLGISTEGKTAKQLLAEIKEKRKASLASKHQGNLKALQTRAQKLGIPTDGKTAKELLAAIKAKQKERKQQISGNHSAKTQA